MTPPGTEVQKVITFFYYRNLSAAMAFYEQVLGLALAIDQGWCKIYQIGGQAHVGLVDEAKGMNRATADKPVQLCIRVTDVAAWHDYATQANLPDLSELRENEALGIKAFVFRDPEGYQIEIQQATRDGA